jgi:hypothetical protein
MRAAALLGILCCALFAAAQDNEKGIQDNSFLVEEAYNQEFGVVQHIQTFQRDWNSNSWFYTFTQEWPMDAAPRNQLSYTIPALRDPATGAGMGDVLLNYRYQLVGNGETKYAFAPRLSLVLPTGDSQQLRGQGGVGVQTMLPLSLVLSKHWVTHWNLGATITPAAKAVNGQTAATYGYNAGQSAIWTVKPRFNVLVETVFNSSESVLSRGVTQRTNSILVSPGVRWAYNFKSALQIVPGVAVPLGVRPSNGERSVFLYLSFEHPYRKMK